MNEEDAKILRAHKLQSLLRTKFNGDRQELIRQAGVSRALISKMLTAGFGRLAAVSFERRLDLPPETLDVAPDPPDPPPLIAAKDIDRLIRAVRESSADIVRALRAIQRQAHRK